MARAAGLARTNQMDTIALSAAALMAAQPAPLSTAARNICHGSAATAQPHTPNAALVAAALVTAAANPKRRYNEGRLAVADGPDQELHCHGSRDQRYRPAARLVHDAEENRRGVEARAPAEHSQHEACANHAPAKKPGIPHRRRGARLRFHIHGGGTMPAGGSERYDLDRSDRQAGAHLGMARITLPACDRSRARWHELLRCMQAGNRSSVRALHLVGALLFNGPQLPGALAPAGHTDRKTHTS